MKKLLPALSFLYQICPPSFYKSHILNRVINIIYIVIHCDFCYIGRCFDLFTDCAQQISKHTSYGANDPEAIRGCRKTCGLCSTIPKSGTG